MKKTGESVSKLAVVIEGVVKVEARRLVREEAELVHEPEHWDKLHELMELRQEEMDEVAENMNSIYLNPFSLALSLLHL